MLFSRSLLFKASVSLPQGWLTWELHQVIIAKVVPFREAVLFSCLVLFIFYSPSALLCSSPWLLWGQVVLWGQPGCLQRMMWCIYTPALPECWAASLWRRRQRLCHSSGASWVLDLVSNKPRRCQVQLQPFHHACPFASRDESDAVTGCQWLVLILPQRSMGNSSEPH